MNSYYGGGQMNQKLIKISESLKVKKYFDKALTNNKQIQLWIPISVDEKKIINTKIDKIIRMKNLI